MNLIDYILQQGKQTQMTDEDIILQELQGFRSSQTYQTMLTGSSYYQGIQDIDTKTRTAIGKSGQPVPVSNLPNSKIKDNRYTKLVDQKASYLLSKPLEILTDDQTYKNELTTIFNKSFMRKLKNVAIDALNGGIAYLYPYIENNTLSFKRFAPSSIIPLWTDEEHETLQAFIRFYDVTVYEGRQPTVQTKVEYYTLNGCKYYTYDGATLVPDVEREDTPYITANNTAYNWPTIPLIAFKYNALEIPLITRVKSLQDALNTLLSNYSDQLQENTHNTILVLENYDGQDLGEFRKNLNTYGVVKVRSIDGGKGDVRTLSIEVNSENYKLIVQMIRNAITENGRGFDGKDDRLTNNPNQMNIRSMYSDIDLDASLMESEFQASLEHLLTFVNSYLQTFKNITPTPVEFVFNKDLPQDENSVITACQNSIGILSRRTIIKNHPWTKNTDEELKEIEKEDTYDGSSYTLGHEHHD